MQALPTEEIKSFQQWHENFSEVSKEVVKLDFDSWYAQYNEAKLLGNVEKMKALVQDWYR